MNARIEIWSKTQLVGVTGISCVCMHACSRFSGLMQYVFSVKLLFNSLIYTEKKF